MSALLFLQLMKNYFNLPPKHVHIRKKKSIESEVEFMRMSLASRTSLRTHFKVLGLEAYKSSKMSCPQLKNSTFFDLLKLSHGYNLLFTLPWKMKETSQKIGEDLFFFLRSPKNFFWGPSFFLGEHLCVVSLALSIPVLGLERVCLQEVDPWPWPRISFVSLASMVVSSTPPLFYRMEKICYVPNSQVCN